MTTGHEPTEQPTTASGELDTKGEIQELDPSAAEDVTESTLVTKRSAVPVATYDDDDEPVPEPPKTLAETGLSESFLTDLALKHIYFGGEVEAIEVASRLALDFPIVSPLLDKLKKEKLIMGMGGSSVLGGMRIVYAITDLGRKKIDQVLNRDNYRGPAPVPFEQYVAQLERQSIRNAQITSEEVERAFGGMILDAGVVDRLGPAINSGRSIFLYGPPGNGKTSMAECIIETIGGRVFIPHTIIVDSEVVRVYDELYHSPLPSESGYDERWVATSRPVVVAGGELMLEMLDLRWGQQSTFYEAPFQVKANSGVLFIDDFGRQRCDPQELLNRWIVPLESGFDFMTFRSGQKAKVPFDNLIVFSTNLDPKELVDEAFLRRIRYKIEVSDPSADNYKAIFRKVCDRYEIDCDDAVINYLVHKHYQIAKRPMRCCHPRDLVEQLVDLTRFTGEEPRLTKALVDRLCELYFVDL